MDDFIEAIVRHIGCTSGAIMVVDEKAQLLRCAASYNMSKEWTNLTNKLEEDSGNTNGTVAVTGILQVHNAQPVEFHGHHIYSWAAVPVVRDGKVIANIEVIDSDKYEFSEQDIEFLKSSASQLRVL